MAKIVLAKKDFEEVLSILDEYGSKSKPSKAKIKKANFIYGKMAIQIYSPEEFRKKIRRMI